MIWKPNVTVAAVAVRDGKHLLVEEREDGKLVLNQPAGHLDEGESLLDAVVRETLEETAWHFVPEFLIGIYRWPYPAKGVTYLRFAFAGHVTGHDPARTLDRGVVRAVWLTAQEIVRDAARHRSPQVQRTLDDYLAGRRYSLELLNEVV
ncbi:MAG: NUDIX hydrolase [Gammaproteobacteria bacterium]|nr:NUDIX hydrolase [Gammaproteobacteria bacterium]